MKRKKTKLIRFISVVVVVFVLLVFLSSLFGNTNEKRATNYQLLSNRPLFYADPSVPFLSEPGTSVSPYIIKNEDDMRTLSAAVLVASNGGFAGKYFDIDGNASNYFDLSSDFFAIGNATYRFKGNFNGRGVQFKLDIDETANYQGLFGYLEAGSISNLSVTGRVSGGSYVAGIVGYQLSGTIEAVYNLATIEGAGYLGGIVGYQANGTISQVYNNGNVTGTGSQIGGIVGQFYQGTIANTYNRGEIIGNSNVGGITGFAYAYRNISSTVTLGTVVLTNSYSSGKVSANSNAGGVIGFLNMSNYNSRNYSTTRTNLYYDISVLALYDQPRTLKPVITNSSTGYTTDKLIYGTPAGLKFPAATWTFKEEVGSTAYYPQLKVFSDNDNQSIVTNSLTSVACNTSRGFGSATIPFLIRNKSEMDELSAKVIAGNNYETLHFKISNDYSETNLGDFIPIGSNTKPFYGSFDGNHVQFILNIDNSASYQGLFGYFGIGTIENLSVTGRVSGGSYVAGVVGYQLSGTIETVYNLATIEGVSYLGGIVGWQANGTITKVYNDGNIIGTGEQIGGIVGRLYQGTVTNTYNRGEIIGNSNVGGITGYTYAYRNINSDQATITITFTHSYSSGLVSANTNAGGVIGFLNMSNYNSRNYSTTRTNLYYDISVLASYDQPKNLKPSTEASTQGLNSQLFFTAMQARLGATSWVFEEMTDDFAYYPQLKVFSNSEINNVKQNSESSVKVAIGDGLGTATIPFLIRNKSEMEELSASVNAGNNYTGFYFKVADDYSETNLGDFIPIGSNTKPFYGSFDGNHVQFILDIDNDESYQGLFGYFGVGTIKNLSVTGRVSGGSYVAGVVGYQLSGTIEAVYNLATIEGVSYLGGIVGYQANGTISQVYNNGNVTGTGSQIGGIVGRLDQGTIANTYNRGEIIGNSQVGGITGYAYLYKRIGKDVYKHISLSYSYSSGLVSANTNAGGVIGLLATGYYHGGSGGSNTFTYIYYNATNFIFYSPPRAQKPSSAIGGQGLALATMLENGMSRLLPGGIWEFKSTEGFDAYYPQLKVFSLSENAQIENDSIESVKTLPFLGDGTQDFPYIIKTPVDMQAVSSYVAAGFDTSDIYYLVDEGVYDFDLTSLLYSPIGTANNPFKGHFDGNYANFHLGIESTDNYQALFGYIDEDASVKNLSVTGNIEGTNYVASIVGYNKGLVEKVYSIATIKGNSNIGGVVGYNSGTINLAYNNGEIIGDSNVGGVVGYNSGNIDNVHNGNILYGNSNIGGVVGYNAGGDIDNAYYNLTAINYFVQPSGDKPGFAIGNENNTNTVRGLEKDLMKTIDEYSLNPDEWVETATVGMYDYLPQIKDFTLQHQTIKNKSLISARLFRFEQGKGTESNPFIIRNRDDMKLMSTVSLQDSMLGFYFKVDDGIDLIDLSEEAGPLGFSPIGINAYRFKGHFDGNDTKFNVDIKGVVDFRGLFAYTENASITNLSITGTIVGRDYVGGVVGYALNTQIENVYNFANIQARNYIGGIVGHAVTGTTIKYAYNYGTISGTGHIGGIIGNTKKATISYVYNRNSIAGTGSYIGGIIGYMNSVAINETGLLDNSYSASTISGTSYLGGIVGYIAGNGAVTNSYYDVSIIDADTKSPRNRPEQAISNVLDQEDVRGIGKAYLTGLSNLTLDSDAWQLRMNQGSVAYYPQLIAFSSNSKNQIKADSLSSVESFIFAGEGTETSPFIIVNELDMKMLSELNNGGEDFEGVYFKVRENASEFDLSMNGLNYAPIGTNAYPFKGKFDGSGANFILDIIGGNYLGLFGVVDEEVVIYNLSTSGTIEASNYAGGIVAYNKGFVHTVYTTVTIKGNDYIGGIIGYNNGTLKEGFSIGQVDGELYVGGIVAYNNGSIENVYVVSSVSGQNYIGGIVGHNSGDINYAYYNEEVVQFYFPSSGVKPNQAVGNQLNTESIKGLSSAKMHYATLQYMIFETPSKWVPKECFGFEAYYPQLAYFVNNKNPDTQLQSLLAVTKLLLDGEGTEEDPFIIRTADDMQALSQLVANKNTFNGKYLKVAEEVSFIDLTELEIPYVPIGNEYYRFLGHFDGTETMFKLHVDNDIYYQGLFGFIGVNGVVKNLSISEDSYIKALRFAGGVAGRNIGLIENVYNLGEVVAQDYYAGGITGYNDGKIINAYNTGNISVITTYYAGGIAGYSIVNSEIENVYNTGNIYARAYSGGLAGLLGGKVFNSYSIGEVTGVSYLGGLFGAANGYANVKNCYYDLSVISYQEGNKPIRAISNIEDTSTCKGVTSAELSGTNLLFVEFDNEIFKYISNNDYIAYHPQLLVFANSFNNTIKNDSLLSVTKKIFQGEGSEESPFMIINERDMKTLSSLVLEGTNTYDVYFKVYKENLEFDLTLALLDYLPIGNGNIAFAGHFDGNNATFEVNLNKNDNYIGLFGKTNSSSSIKNLTVIGEISALMYTGGIVAYNEADLENVVNLATISGTSFVGGLAGYHMGIIRDSYNKGDITSSGTYTGGLVAYNDGASLITLSYNMGDITASNQHVGGITAYNHLDASISYSFNHGDITSSAAQVGGIVSLNEGIINNVYNTGNLETSANYIAGIAAKNTGTISNVYHGAYIVGNNYAAGISSINTGLIDKAYYDGDNVNKRYAPATSQEVVSAIFGEIDSGEVKAMPLTQMTGLNAIGNNGEQLDFEYDDYITRKGNDFTYYYPEMYYFYSHADQKRKADSLESITSKILLGEGTQNDPYLIYDGYDMMILHEFLIKGNFFLGKYFKVADGVMTIDLRLADLNYVPVGNNPESFEGNFDGNNVNFILDLNNPNEDYMGVFHTLGANSVIKNFTVSGTIIGKSYVGGAAGRSYGVVENIVNNATIKSTITTGSNSIGGILGVSGGTLKDSINRGTIITEGSYVGGLVGENEGLIENSYNKASVKGNAHVGGIAGQNVGTINNVYNTASINGITIIGGIVGENRNIINLAFNDGPIKATTTIVGGIAGYQSENNSMLKFAYHSKSVTSLEEIAGGIVGKLDGGNISDVYVSGTVSGADIIGMIVGHKLGGNVLRAYYDLSMLEDFNPQNLLKPEKAFGDEELKDNDNVKGLFHGQMVGLNAIGNSQRQMKLTPSNTFSLKSSHENNSFYPQLSYFSNHLSEEVLEDSLNSVTTITFYGAGTQADPFQLRDENDVLTLADTVNSGNRYDGKVFKVVDGVTEFNFVDAEENYQFIVIGNNGHNFNGIIDGNGVNFKLSINSNNDYQGIFSILEKDAIIYNMSVSGDISGRHYVSGIAALNKGYIHDVYNQANINGQNYTAGIAGVNEGKIENAYNKGNIKGHNYVGGISAYVKEENEIKYTYNIGVIYGKENVGAIAGYLESYYVFNSYYDTRILGAYRDADGFIKPTGAIGNSANSETVYGLDKAFMVGINAIGSSNLQMDLPLSNFTVNHNQDGNNYPQLKVFSTSSLEDVKEASFESTQTHFYVITYNDNGATGNIKVASFVLPDYHYKLNVPIKYGFELEGWYYQDALGNQIRYTDNQGLSLEVYSNEEDISVFANWVVAEYNVVFVDGNNSVIESIKVEHGSLISPTKLIPTKTPSLTKIFFFDRWDFDFSTKIFENTTIFAVFTEADRYYYVTFFDGDNNFYTVEKVEYGHKVSIPNGVPTKVFDTYAYRFIAWDFDFAEEIYEAKEVESLFEPVQRWYTVSFVNEDNTILEEDLVEYGSSAFAPLETPQKEATVSHVFEFIGWDKAFDFIDSDLTIKAVYAPHARHYAVKFYDDDYSLLKEESVAYGSFATAPIQIPQKAFHDDSAYKFTAWDKAFDFVEEDLIIRPIFEEIPRWYSVSFVNEDDEIIETQTVEYRKNAIAPLEIPQKEASISHVFEFAGWDKPYDCIEANLTVKATFIMLDRYYQVTFYDGDNQIIETQDIVYMGSANAPEMIPRKAPQGDKAYRFRGWDKEFNIILDDLIVTAEFEEIDRYYQVAFYDGDNEIFGSVIMVEYMSPAPLPEATPTKMPSEQYIYSFAHWDDSYFMILGNTIVYSYYNEALRPFTVIFKDGDGEIFDSQTVLYGQNAILPQGTPSKSPDEAEDGYAYKFDSWSGSFENIISDTVIEARFTPVNKYYTVTYYGGDDLTMALKIDKVFYMNASIPPEIPSKTPPSEAYETVFVAWELNPSTGNLNSVIENLIATAKYENIIKKYTVTVINGDETTTHIVNYNSNLNLPVPYKTGSLKIIYDFVHWEYEGTTVSSPLRNIKQDMTVVAIFEEVHNYYVVTFVDGDDNEVSVQEVIKGNDAIAPNLTPTKTHSDPNKLWIFSSWDRALTDIDQDLTIKALFVEIDKYYTVTFLDALDNPYYMDIVEYNKHASLPETPPIKPHDSMYEYEFAAWESGYTNVKENKTIKPIYSKSLRKFRVEFIDGDEIVIRSVLVEYGKSALAPITASKTPTATDYYLFTTWDKDYSNITSDLEVIAEFSRVDRYYEVKFMGVDINDQAIELDVQMVEYGKNASDPILQIEPQQIGIDKITTIVAWDKAFDNITSSLVVNAQYDEVDRWYNVYFLDEHDVEIHNDVIEYGNPVNFILAPTKSADEDYRYEFDKWVIVAGSFNANISYVTEDLSFKATYKALPNIFTVVFKDGDNELLFTQNVAYGDDATFPSGTTPTKTPSERYEYEFLEWDQALTNIREDKVITAVFGQKDRVYTVLFVGENEEVLKTETLAYGSAATAPELIHLPPNSQEYTYSYRWDKSFDYITDNLLVRLIIEASKQQYTYIFYDSENNEYRKVTTSYGSVIETPPAPEKEFTTQFIYHFTDWDKEVPLYLTDNMEFYPVYSFEVRKYTVTFLDGNGNFFWNEEVEYGSNGQMPVDIPTKNSTQKNYYVFRVWERRPVSVREDMTIEPLFNSFLQVYTVTFVTHDGVVIKVQEVEYGTGATEPEFGTFTLKPSTNEYEYVFVGWDKPFNYITGDIVVQPRYSQIVRIYTYTFYDDDNITILKQAKGRYGSNIIPPQTPTKPGSPGIQYEFIGWDKTVAATLVENVAYYARYKITVVSYNVIFYNGDGSILEIQVIEHGSDAVSPSIIPTKEKTEMYQYDFKNWDQNYNNIIRDMQIYPIFDQRLRDLTVNFHYIDQTREFITPYGSTLVGKVSTPSKPGYYFVRWDQDFSYIVRDMDIYPEFESNIYDIYFNGNGSDNGTMVSIVGAYEKEVLLPLNEFSRKGYIFIGWKETPEDDDIIYQNGQKIVFNKTETLYLYAHWQIIEFDIIYDLDGGVNSINNPAKYTVEDTIILEPAIKQDYLCIGWMLEILEGNEKQDLIDIINLGTIGTVVLTAVYRYNGFIELKEESMLGMYYADITVIENIVIREDKYDEANPIYLLGVYLGQTLENLRENFVNENLVFRDKDGNNLTDDMVVATGQQIVLLGDGGEVIDRVRIVLKGDTDGNGLLNAMDYALLQSIVRDVLIIEKEYLLALLINEDEIINAVDYAMLQGHIRGEQLLHDPNQITTMR